MTQDLVPHPEPTTSGKITSGVVSPRLRELLEAQSGSEDAAIEEIVGSPVLLDLAKSALPILKAQAAQPAGEEGVKAVVGARFVTYPQPQRSETEWALWWGDWVTVCGDVSWVALEAGMQAWVKLADSEFLPKPGRLRELGRTVANPATAAWWLALRAVKLAEERAARAQPSVAPPLAQIRKMPTDADRAAIREMHAQYEASMVRRREEMAAANPKPELPYIGGIPAHGSALTPQMLKLLGRPIPKAPPPSDGPAAFSEDC